MLLVRDVKYVSTCSNSVFVQLITGSVYEHGRWRLGVRNGIISDCQNSGDFQKKYRHQKFGNCPALSSPLLLCYRIKELDFEKLDLYEFLRHVKTCESDGLPEFQEFVFFA